MADRRGIDGRAGRGCGRDVGGSVGAFAADAVAAILALTKGDALAITGRAKLTSWEKDGEEKQGLSVMADKVLSAYRIEKKRRQASQQ